MTLFGDQAKREGKSAPTKSGEVKVWQSPEWAVRTVWHKGEWWFVAGDVCRCLSISDTRQAVERLRGGEWYQIPVTDATGRKQKSYVVSEPGLYRLIFRSDKPEAEAFQDWVFKEVLPQIRKTGKYEIPKKAPDAIDREAKRLRSDRETAKARLENCKNNYEIAAQLARAGAIDPREYARMHNEGYRGAFDTDAAGLREGLGLKKHETPLDRMDAIPLTILDLGKLIALKRQEANPNPTPADLVEDYGRATREVRESTIGHLNSNTERVRFVLGIAVDPKRGKILACRPLSLPSQRPPGGA